MTVDTRGRAAASGLREVTGPGVDVAAGLAEMARMRARRARVQAVAAAVTVVVLVAAGVLAIHHLSTRVDRSSVQPSASPCPPEYQKGAVSGVTCLSGNLFRLQMLVPLTVRVPPQWLKIVKPGRDEAGFSPQSAGPGEGLWIFEAVVPLLPDSGQQTRRDSSAGSSAQSFATWLSTRPDFEPTKVERTTVGGRPAYQVDVTLKADYSLVLPDGQRTTKYPTFAVPSQPGAATWQTPTVPTRYTLLDLPGGGVMAAAQYLGVSTATTSQSILDSLELH